MLTHWFQYFRWTSYGWRPLWSTMGKEQGKSSLSGLNRRRKASTCRRRKKHGLNYFDVISTSKHERNPCVEEIKSWKCYQMKSAAKFWVHVDQPNSHGLWIKTVKNFVFCTDSYKNAIVKNILPRASTSPVGV